QARVGEFHAGKLLLRGARSGVVPWPDDQEVSRARFGRGGVHITAIVGQGAGLIVVIHAGDGEDGYPHLGVLFTARVVALPIVVHVGMIDPFLIDGRRVADKAIQPAVRRAGFGPSTPHADPKRVVAEQVILAGATAGKREPLDVVGA